MYTHSFEECPFYLESDIENPDQTFKCKECSVILLFSCWGVGGGGGLCFVAFLVPSFNMLIVVHNSKHAFRH